MISKSRLPAVSMAFTYGSACGSIEGQIRVSWEKLDATGGESLVLFHTENMDEILVVDPDEIIALAEAIKAARREDERLRMIRDGKH